MVPPARTPLRADRLRPLNAPLPVTVEKDSDGNLKTVGSGERYVSLPFAGSLRTVENRSPLPAPPVSVETILDSWQLDDEWWRQRISRRYVAVMLEGGKRVLLFEDLITGEWFEQTP